MQPLLFRLAPALGLLALLNGCGGGAADAPTGITAAGDPRSVQAAAAVSLPAGRYTLVNANSGKCVEVEGGAQNDGANIRQAVCTGAAQQAFDLVAAGDGLYELTVASSGKAMDVSGASTADGANIQQWSVNHTGAQRFRLQTPGSERYTLVNANSGKCVDVAGASTADGANVQQYTCNGTGAQLFLFKPSGGTVPAGKSAKRGVAYDLSDPRDLEAVSPGVSWWYNWSPQPQASVPADHASRWSMDFLPMLWNGHYDSAQVEAFLKAHPQIKYLLVMNEPNLVDQANLTPAQAAAVWPGYEALARNTGVKIVGPQVTWGTMPGYGDPVVWLDAFYAAYRSANGNRDPQIDYLGFHWYDYGLAGQLDRLKKYGKPFWVTEFANWHAQNDGAQIDTLEKQKAQMTDMVATCEQRDDVFRYAWFTGRWPNDVHHTSLLAGSGELTELGRLYLGLPFRQP